MASSFCARSTASSLRQVISSSLVVVERSEPNGVHFKDGSLFDETVVFTQQRVFTMNTYHLVQRGPAFFDDTEISLERATGKYHVKTKTHKDGKEEVLDGKLDLPLDVYNGGMVLTAAKNLRKGASETVHTVAFTPHAPAHRAGTCTCG